MTLPFADASRRMAFCQASLQIKLPICGEFAAVMMFKISMDGL